MLAVYGTALYGEAVSKAVAIEHETGLGASVETVNTRTRPHVGEAFARLPEYTGPRRRIASGTFVTGKVKASL